MPENMTMLYRRSILPYFLLFSILLFSIFSMPVKSLTSQFIGGIVPSIICILLIMHLLLYQSKYPGRFRLNKLDLPILVLLSYNVFHIFYSHISQNTFFDALQYYRVQLLSIAIYFFVRKELFLQEDNRKYIINILSIIYLIILIDLTVESILRNIYGIDLSMLPWVEKMSLVEAKIFTGLGIRVPTIFGMPHKAGLLAVSSVVYYYFLFKIRGKRVYLLATLFAIINVILSNSYSALLILLLIFFMLRKEKIFIKTALMFSLASVIIFSYIFSKYSQYSISFSKIIYDGILAYLDTFDSEKLKLIPFTDMPLWNIYNIATYLFGTGIADSSIYGQVYDFYKMEIGLVLDVLPKQGMFFIFILLLLLLYPIRIKTSMPDIRYLKIMLLPFYLAMLHYWITFHMGVFEIFITLYGLLISEIINYRKRHKIMSATETWVERGLHRKINSQPL